MRRCQIMDAKGGCGHVGKRNVWELASAQASLTSEEKSSERMTQTILYPNKVSGTVNFKGPLKTGYIEKVHTQVLWFWLGLFYVMLSYFLRQIIIDWSEWKEAHFIGCHVQNCSGVCFHAFQFVALLSVVVCPSSPVLCWNLRGLGRVSCDHPIRVWAPLNDARGVSIGTAVNNCVCELWGVEFVHSGADINTPGNTVD